MFRLRHEENPACIVAEETQDFQVDQRFEALPQCWAMRKQDVLFHAGRRFGRLVPTEASTLRKPVYLTFSCPNDFAPPTWVSGFCSLTAYAECTFFQLTSRHVAWCLFRFSENLRHRLRRILKNQVSVSLNVSHSYTLLAHLSCILYVIY